MKIEISKEEYRLLLDLLYLSDWVINSHGSSGEDSDSQYNALRKKLLSYYKVMGAEDVIEYVAAYDDYYEKQDYERALDKKFIEPYEEEVFWERLIERLAERDMMNTLGIENYHRLSPLRRAEYLMPLQAFYSHEFGVRGLSSLVLTESLRTTPTWH